MKKYQKMSSSKIAPCCQNHPKIEEILQNPETCYFLSTFSLAHFLSPCKLERMCENTGRSERAVLVETKTGEEGN